MFRAPGPFLYGALIVGAVLDAESQKQETFAETVAGIVITIVLLWLAHAYAEVVGERVEKGEHLSLRLIGNKMANELAILTGAALPLLIVLIWWASGGSLSGALSAGVWTAAITIVAANVLAGFRANLSGADLVFQTAVGAFLGLGILVLKLIFH
jgi:hypothetical protein